MSHEAITAIAITVGDIGHVPTSTEKRIASDTLARVVSDMSPTTARHTASATTVSARAADRTHRSTLPTAPTTWVGTAMSTHTPITVGRTITGTTRTNEYHLQDHSAAPSGAAFFFKITSATLLL